LKEQREHLITSLKSSMLTKANKEYQFVQEYIMLIDGKSDEEILKAEFQSCKIVDLFTV
jgi:hypothetical protein